jgi:hypothetical protein
LYKLKKEPFMVAWHYYLAYFFAGAFLANSVPHLVQGICGNAFQSPFASPPGKGESSAIVNAAWGWVNLAIGAALLRYFFLSPPPWRLCATGGIGLLLSSLWLAYHFGKVRNANPHPG